MTTKSLLLRFLRKQFERVSLSQPHCLNLRRIPFPTFRYFVCSLTPSAMMDPIFKINALKVLPCDHSLKNSSEEQKKMESEFSRLLCVAERTNGLYFSYKINLNLRFIEWLVNSGP